MQKWIRLLIFFPYFVFASFTSEEKPPLVYTHDDQGRVTTIKASDHSISYSYTYNEYGLPSSLTNLNTGETVRRFYNSEGLLIAEEFPQGILISFTWNKLGQRESTILPDSLISYAYKENYLTYITRMTPTTTYTHTIAKRDAEGKILEEHLSGNLGSILHEYDAWGREIGLITPIGEEKIEAFNEKGLIEKMSRFSGAYRFEYDDTNQIIEEVGPYLHTYLYDQDQNRINASSLPPLLMEFDAFDRLIRVANQDMRVEISYDGFHRKISQTLLTLQEGTWVEQEKRYFIYDHQQEIGSYTKTSENGIKWIDFRVIVPEDATLCPQTVAVELSDRPFAVISDLQGNGAALISLETGEVEETIPYTAFQEEHPSFLDPKLPWRLQGKRSLPFTDFIDFGRRFYLPSQGRWLTLDPAGEPDGPNRLVYNKNNPLLLRDPYGLESFFSPVFIQAGQAIKDIFKHMIPFSNTRFLGVYIGECFSQGPIAGINYHSHLGSIGELSPESTHINLWINGINTTFEETISAAHMISEACGGEKVYYVYHPTEGFMGDLWDHIFSKLHLRGNTPYLTALGVRMALEEVGEEGSVTIFAHSNGGAILSMALPYLTQKEKDKIEIYTFGTGRFFFPGGVARVTHILSDWDPWPLATDSLRYLLFYIWNPPFFQIKKSPEGSITKIMKNHAFKGPVYSQEVYRIGQEIQERQKKSIIKKSKNSPL